MEEAVYKALYFADNGLDVSGNIPLTRTESDFLIGLTFRYTLMNVIVDSQRRNNLGVLKVNPAKFVRQDSVREIRQINYAEYTEHFVLPYLIKTGRVTSREQVLANTDLTQSTELLRHNPKIRVQICDDDFLLTPSDLPWFHSTFGNQSDGLSRRRASGKSAHPRRSGKIGATVSTKTGLTMNAPFTILKRLLTFKPFAVLALFALLANGCAHYPVNARLKAVNPSTGYRFENAITQTNSDDTSLVLAFSGGGTRAAALSYGVLEELAKTEVGQTYNEHRLLDDVRMVSAVSGGSMTAAYYTL